MGFWLAIIFLTIIVLGGLIFLAYWIPMRYGKRKLGIWLSIILTLVFLTPFFSFVFEDYLFFESDAIQSLAEHEMTLLDEFILESNEMSGIRDFYHCFELEITSADKERLTNMILESGSYRESVPKTFDIRTDKPRYSDTKQEFIVTYQDKWNYVFEYYSPNNQGYTPTWDRISISKDENNLTYERILD